MRAYYEVLYLKNVYSPLLSNNELISNRDVAELISKELEDTMADFGSDEQIREFILFDSERSQDRGELMPAMKHKRSVINQKYSGEIEKFY